MGFSLVTAPAFEPVTLKEAKDHLRVDTANDDALISSFITVARVNAEYFTGRAFITQEWDWFLDCFPGATGILNVPVPPLQSVTSVNYLDVDGNSQLLDGSKYVADSKSIVGRIAPAVDEVWPDTRRTLNAVTIRFKAGYGDFRAKVPEQIKAAMNLLEGHLYENRELSIVAALQKIPMGYEALLWPYRIVEV